MVGSVTLKRGQRALRVYGVRGTVHQGLIKLAHLRNGRQHPDPFDAQHGTDTEATVRLEGLQIEGENVSLGHRYQASNSEDVRKALQALPIAYEDFTFVDVGSGKGRVLLLAAEFNFRRIVGIEFASALHEIALRNIALTGLHERVEAVCTDAAEYEWPEGPLVLYFYNPFLLPVMRKILGGIVASTNGSPRPLYIILMYISPALQAAVEDVGFKQIGDTPLFCHELVQHSAPIAT